jgi:hypothetical protein
MNFEEGRDMAYDKWGAMYEYVRDRFKLLYLDHRKGWDRLDPSGWAEVAKLAGILCEAYGIDRSKVMLRIPDGCVEELVDPSDLMDGFNSGGVEDVFYEREESQGDNRWTVFMAERDLASRFFAKAISMGYEGNLVDSDVGVGG